MTQSILLPADVVELRERSAAHDLAWFERSHDSWLLRRKTTRGSATEFDDLVAAHAAVHYWRGSRRSGMG